MLRLDGRVRADFLVTVPLVSLAERYGHGSVLRLNLIPRLILLAWTLVVGFFDDVIPLKLIMASPFFSVLGGDCVLNSIVYSLVAGSTDDVVLRYVIITTPDTSRQNNALTLLLMQRATYFGRVNAVSSIFAAQLGPALASACMSLSLWLPFWTGMLLLLLALPAIRRLPPLSPIPDYAAVAVMDDDAEDEAPLLRPASPKHPTVFDHHSVTTAVANRFRTIFSIVTSYPRNFSLLLFCFFLTSLASSDTKLLTQYISKRYGWKFTSVGYLLSGKAVFNFFFLYLVLPAILRWRESVRSSRDNVRGRSRSPPPRVREEGRAADGDEETAAAVVASKVNARYAIICIVISVLGALAIAVAWSIWLLIPSLLLYALGIALPVFTYSLLRAPGMVPQRIMRASAYAAGMAEEETGREDAPVVVVGSDAQIFSVVMLVKTVGLLVGAPSMATLWVKGVKVGGWAVGLPFFFSSACYAVACFVMGRIKL